MYSSYCKRILDFLVSLTLIILLFPILVLLWLLVRIFLGSPVIFRQKRPGLHEKPFWIFKFRTMRELVDGEGNLLADGRRLTKFGRLLRSLSLDELPALFNVLKGDMSLVGPRPLLMDYLPFYDAKQRERHDVRPGITGWAQVNGRNALSWRERFLLDVWYVQHCAFLLDLEIMLLTVVKVFRREGISAQGEATMSRFDDECRVNGLENQDETVCHLRDGRIWP